MNLQIHTLTPVHIGSGTELQGNFEYLYFREEQKIAVIDAEKVLQVLGEENLSQWVACIEKNEPLLPLLQSRSKSLQSEDVALRTMTCKTATTKPIREQIRSGSGTYLLPGSSLKGSIRTALWAESVLDNANLAKEKRNLGVTDHRGGFRWSDQMLSKTFFGGDPNHDIFRLLQVGDAAFSETEVFQTDVINKYGNNWRIKQELSQFVEAIPRGASATAQLNFNELLKKRSQATFNRNVAKLELHNLFPLINQHTQRLLEDEINYWTDSADNPEALGDYVTELETILSQTEACREGECVLRLGWGSGFRSMTGDWHGAMSDNDYDRLVKSLRPRHPEDLVFPKTTRFIASGIPLGFIKLSLSNI